MALVLGMDVNKDNEIFIDELRVTVDRVLSPTQVQITVHGDYMEEQKILNNIQYVNVTPNVQMMLGLTVTKQGFCRVMVEAPRNITILRGKLKATAS